MPSLRHGLWLARRRARRWSSEMYRRALERHRPDQWKGQRGLYGVWSLSPPIFVAMHVHDPERTRAMMAPLYEHLRARDAWFLLVYSWATESDQQVARASRYQEAHRTRYPGHRLVHLCNTPRQLEVFRAAGLPAIFCNHNALVDERIYRPMPGIPREFDAVYDARINRFKRHDLALAVPRLALAYARDRSQIDPVYELRMRWRLRHAYHFNRRGNGRAYRHLVPEEIALAYNRCRIGLSLSAEEGANYASIQYLLCGLPVVSTRSRGGRDVFFDAETARIVDDDPRAVRRGVEEMIDRRLDPHRVRAAALVRMREHRERFLAELQRIYDEQGVARSAAVEWDRVFFDKLMLAQPHAEVIERLERSERGDAAPG
jgi:glycosyltransferase involved in cell wall biosynthesis